MTTEKQPLNAEKGSLDNLGLETLFWAYFNNKMTMLLMLIEHPVMAKNSVSVMNQKTFLHDMKHHFLSHHASTKYLRAFEWLELYLDQFEDASCERMYKAICMVGLIYEAFGVALPKRVAQVRIERENPKAMARVRKYLINAAESTQDGAA